jgi:hypothetical protein
MDKRLVVAIDGWDTDSMYPSGHYVRTLGVIGDRDVETVSGFAAVLCGVLPNCWYLSGDLRATHLARVKADLVCCV